MVVVPLVTLNGVEDGKVMFRLKVSFISNKLSSFIVMLNTLSIFPAIKVRFSGSKMKSFPSIKITTSHYIHDTRINIRAYVHIYT